MNIHHVIHFALKAGISLKERDFTSFSNSDIEATSFPALGRWKRYRFVQCTFTVRKFKIAVTTGSSNLNLFTF